MIFTLCQHKLINTFQNKNKIQKITTLAKIQSLMKSDKISQTQNSKASFNGPSTASQMFDLNVKDNANPKQQIPRVDLSHARCQKGNQCMQVCRSEDCDAKGVVCSDRKCQCRNHHKKLCTWVDPFYIIELIEQKRVCNMSLIKDIELKFDALIDEISTLRNLVIEQLKVVGLNQLEKVLLKNLNNKEFDTFNGKLMSKVIENINQNQENFIKQKQEVLFEIVDQNWKEVQSRVMQQCSKISQVISSLKIQEVFDEKQNNKKLLTFPKLESVVVNSAGQIKVMMNFFKQDKRPKSFKLLYRASQNEFRISHFKQKCTNIPNTITLIKTTFDKIIGGYTPLCWKQEGGFQQIKIQSAKFELKNKKKNKAIHNSDNHGPEFGNDLILCNLSNINKNSQVKIGSYYSHPSFEYQTEQTWTKFTGQHEDQYFLTKQWEVFQVQF